MENYNNSCVLLQSASAASDIPFHASTFQNYYQGNLPISLNNLNNYVR